MVPNASKSYNLLFRCKEKKMITNRQNIEITIIMGQLLWLYEQKMEYIDICRMIIIFGVFREAHINYKIDGMYRSISAIIEVSAMVDYSCSFETTNFIFSSVPKNKMKKRLDFKTHRNK